MKIALLGHGKMGHEVEKAALEQGHTIGVILADENDWAEHASQLKHCDVAIDFSLPSVVIDNIRKCMDVEIPMVVGTTGWYAHLSDVTNLCNSRNGALFYASNFSIGVNIFFEINRKLASLLADYDSYKPEMTEIHHLQKIDSPSGTAISLANDITSCNPRYKKYTDSQHPKPDEIKVTSLREGNVPGIHSVNWNSEIDSIKITHEAKNRQGFANGALLAASWLIGRKGVFTMKDMLEFS